jgi:hypothetical protein
MKCHFHCRFRRGASYCKLAEGYNIEDKIVCVNDDVEEVELHKSWVTLTVYEVGKFLHGDRECSKV